MLTKRMARPQQLTMVRSFKMVEIDSHILMHCQIYLTELVQGATD